jgi:hypothetical protein
MENSGGCVTVIVFALFAILIGAAIGEHFTLKAAKSPARAWEIYVEARDYELNRHREALGK